MNIEHVLMLLIGGGGIGGFVSAWLTRRSQREGTEIDLLDRAYKEITRLDKKINELEEELRKEKGDNEELRKIIKDLRESMELLRNDLKKYEKRKV